MDFNEKAFINCSDYPDFDRVLERVIELDTDNNQYMEMLRAPVFRENYLEQNKEELEKFLIHIFEQEKEEAFRRPAHPCASVVAQHEKRLRFLNFFYKNRISNFLRRVSRVCR